MALCGGYRPGRVEQTLLRSRLLSLLFSFFKLAFAILVIFLVISAWLVGAATGALCWTRGRVPRARAGRTAAKGGHPSDLVAWIDERKALIPMGACVDCTPRCVPTVQSPISDAVLALASAANTCVCTVCCAGVCRFRSNPCRHGSSVRDWCTVGALFPVGD